MNRHYGTPPNPAALHRVTGGSSSGPAAAVALGDAEVGLGTDTAGSIRVPASCCGLYGLRPTHGAVSLDGVHGLAPSFDTAGWLARDAATLRAVGAVLLPPGEPLADPVPDRLLLPTGLLAAVPLTVADALRAAARSTAARWGAEVEEAPLSWIANLPALLASFRGVQAAEAWRLHGKWIDAHPGALAPDVEGRFRYGSTVPEAGEQHDREVLARWRAEVTAQISDRTWLALPAAGGPGHARTAGDDAKDAWRQATLRCTVLASACGLPSAVLPAAAVPPIGLALVAPPGADRALLAALTWSHRG
jgi:Asp-tRNA(Asn)/Glu-tRNA(Gln) amidotransferase A subunit family amidase